MATDWRWYFGDRDYYLRDRTEALASELASAASRERSERNRLAKRQGSLEERLDRLTDDVHRLVELSDLRDELDFFVDHEAVRRRVRAALVALELLGPSGRPMAPGATFELRDDTVDYWLGPATRSLPRVLAGAEPVDDPDVVEARRRDAERTDRFLALVLGLTGQGERVAALVPTLLGPVVDGQVSGAQRALWLAAAAGGFGPDARQATAGWLREQVAALRAPSAEAVARWRTLSLASGGSPTATGTAAAGTAAAMLKALPVTVGRIYEPPLLAAWGLEALTARMAAAAAAWSELPAGGHLDDDRRAGLQGALVALVDEGSPAEAPLLRRAESLRRQLRTAEEVAAGAAPVLPDPDAPAGSLADLVVGDALTPAAGAPGPLTALAWRGGAPVLAHVVQAIASVAGQLPATVEPVEIQVGGTTLPVSGEPLAPGRIQAAAEAAAEVSYPTPSGLLGRLRDDENASARLTEQRRHVQRIESAQAALTALRIEVERVRAVPAAAEAALARLSAP